MNDERRFEPADRVKKLPPYVFVQIDRIKKEEAAKGRRLFSLGVGDPDLPAPDAVIARLAAAAKKPDAHQYPSYWGMREFRRAVARWYSRRFNVELNPENEVLTLIGSKEGLAHLPLAFVNPGDTTLVPDPSYPVYGNGTLFAGGLPLPFALREKNGFLPDLAELDELITQYDRQGRRPRLLFLNYPNNPTSACATLDFFEQIAAFAKSRGLLVVHDNAYSEIYYDGKRQPSFLQARGALEVGCETHSLSKTFNMAGWRVGCLVGNRKIVETVAEIKTNIDSGVFNAVQEASIEALDQAEGLTENIRRVYQERRDVLVPAIRGLGMQCRAPEASFYIWAKIPDARSSAEFVLELIQKRGIVAMPGSGFGRSGEGFVRFSFCLPTSELKQVAELLKTSV